MDTKSSAKNIRTAAATATLAVTASFWCCVDNTVIQHTLIMLLASDELLAQTQCTPGPHAIRMQQGLFSIA
jgi:hypothetical protein